MKKQLIALAIVIMAGFSAKAQDCFQYFPQKEGTVMESKHYDKKDKETATSTLTILKKTEKGSEQRIDVKMESTSPQSDSVFTQEYAYICKDGKFYVDMSAYLGNQLAAYQNMSMEVDADNLEIPTNPKEGQQLPGGTVKAKITNQGMPLMTITVTITDRKVEKWETIKTPAGEFKCFKIIQKSESKIGFIKVKASSAEWIAEGTGVVRSEAYDKKGKLVSYTVLSKLTK